MMEKLYKLFIADWNKISDKKEIMTQYLQGTYFFSTILIHIMLLIYFIVFTNYMFIILNINSLVLNSVFLIMNRKKHHDIAILCSSFEAILYGTVSVCLIGWIGGFQWYTLVALLPYYLFIYISKKAKITITTLAIIAFYFGYFYSMTHTATVTNLAIEILVFMNFNILLFAIFLEIKINDLALKVNTQYIEKLETHANQDQLTGLWNRRYAENFFQNDFDSSQTSCVALVDIDYFKNINDTYGHDAGDQVLIEFSEFLLKSVRASDTVIRWGGEEILVILHNVRLKKAFDIMDNIRVIAGQKIYTIGDTEVSFTITIGLVETDVNKEPNEIIRESDICMYYGKENGRNRVVTLDMLNNTAE